MNVKFLRRVLAWALLVSLCLSGCGSAPVLETQLSETTPAASMAEETTLPATEETVPASEATVAGSEATVSASHTNEEPVVPQTLPVLEDSMTEPLATEADLSLADAQSVSQDSVLLADAAPPQEMAQPEEITDQQAEEIERSFRDYKGPDNRYGDEAYSYNPAPYFYLYDALDQDEQAIYDAILLAAADPYAAKRHIPCTVSTDPTSKTFSRKWGRAQEALTSDHPELFWLDLDDQTEVRCHYKKRSTNNRWQVYFYLNNIPSDLSVQIVRFNRQVNTFLDMMNAYGTEKEIAKRTHDFLIYNLSYDYDEKNYRTHPSAHTAYSALLNNESGETFKAVCDGYSKAYLYLLQMQGISGLILVGYAGSDANSAGYHAWNLLNLDGRWYETDITWDDRNDMTPDLTDSRNIKYFKESRNDWNFMEKLTHQMFCISTDRMTNFNPGSEFDYYTKDGRYIYHYSGNSVHIRSNQQNDSYMGVVMERLPYAY